MLRQTIKSQRRSPSRTKLVFKIQSRGALRLSSTRLPGTGEPPPLPRSRLFPLGLVGRSVLLQKYPRDSRRSPPGSAPPRRFCGPSGVIEVSDACGWHGVAEVKWASRSVGGSLRTLALVSNHVMKPCSVQNRFSSSASISTPSMSHLFASSTTGRGLPFGKRTFESISFFHFATVSNVRGWPWYGWHGRRSVDGGGWSQRD